MSDQSTPPSRRAVLSAGTTLLAGFGLGIGPFATTATAGSGQPPRSSSGSELAAYRPVSVSSTDYAATPAEFAVDGLGTAGVRGSGWRAAAGDPQWISVDLQARCRVESLRLVFEATLDDPPFTDSPSGSPRNDTTGQEILSSCAVGFVIETSREGGTWTTVYRTDSGTGGVMEITLSEPVEARWVRMTVHKRSNTNPLGLNGLQVYGTCDAPRPGATGWTDWGTRPRSPEPLHVAADGTVPLESGWDLTLDDWADGDGTALSRPSVDTSRWLPATVPGTVLASLVDQGKLPDPVSGLHNLRVPEALSRHSWWYRREFRLPGGLRTGAGRRVWLEFDGINHRAEVWLNGSRAGDLAFPFARAAFDVTELLADGPAQALAVRITPIPFPGSPGDKGPAGLAFVDAGANMMNRNSPTYLAASGWDWMPAVRDRAAGIWNHVRLRSTGPVVLGDPRVDTRLPDLPDTGTAELTVVVPVRNTGTGSARVTVTAAFGDVRVSQTVTVPASETADAVLTPADHPRLRLQKPELWWPNGYGEPTLHRLTLTASVGGEESDRRTTRFGIRQFGYEDEVPLTFPPGGNAVAQTVDLTRRTARYVRVLCGTRATGWGASMWSLAVLDSSAPDTDLALHRTATASSVDDPGHGPGNATDGDPGTRWSSAFEDGQWIQVDLGGAVPFDRVVITWETAYARTYTVQVSDDGSDWTDVRSVDNSTVPLKISVNGVRVFCRGGNWGWDELLRRMPAGRMDTAVRLHRDMNFTMVRNWVGSSNREEFYASCDEHGLLVWNDFPNAWAMDPPDHQAFLDLARDTVRRYRIHPSVVVWCGANEGNPPGPVDDGMRTAVREEAPGVLFQNNSAAGIVSGGGPYGWVEPERYSSPSTYGGGSFGFHTEIGMPVVPTAETMRRLVGDEPEWPVGGAWYLHDWSTRGNQAPQNYRAAIESRLGAATDLDDFCRKAQFVNYENIRAMFEAWNARLWDDASGLMLWMSHPAWYSTVWQTYDYDFDVNGAYYGARKAAEPLHVQADPVDGRVIAVNHTPRPVGGATVTARRYDLTGRQVAPERSATVDIAPSAATTAFTAPVEDGLPDLHLLRLRLTDARGTLLSENTYWRYRSPEAMQALSRMERTRISVGPTRTERHTTTTRVTNRGPAVAAMLRVSLHDARSGDRVLPTLYSDNYLWLLPGESRTITATWPADLPVTRPSLRVEGYNVPRATTP
ncbi:discoidin domain-containing protein [Streptomyces hyaluromycini]|uniref:discoidin domain-containing protein n=1 Tax=Streptomyces hyaluromycini TaxID=1377993 RepID=UPI000B5C225A|nr:discoidin domain-containing protein [Streptomyces hyaluromycini]